MRKEKEVITKQVEYTCDFCTEPGRYRCECCHKDVCYKHGRDDGDGDHPDRFCFKCWEVGESFRKEIYKIHNDAYAMEEKLRAEWFQKAKMISRASRPDREEKT